VGMGPDRSIVRFPGSVVGSHRCRRRNLCQGTERL